MRLFHKNKEEFEEDGDVGIEKLKNKVKRKKCWGLGNASNCVNMEYEAIDIDGDDPGPQRSTEG